MVRRRHPRRGETPQQERLVITMTTQHTPTYYRIRTAVRCAFLIGVALVAFMTGKALAGNPYSFRCDGSAVVANTGDTMWSLAYDHCEGHTGAAVDTLVQRYGTTLQVGDIISLAIKG